jgi:hypothetical protein
MLQAHARHPERGPVVRPRRHPHRRGPPPQGPSEKLEAVEAIVPPELRRGLFQAQDTLIASLLAHIVSPA